MYNNTKTKAELELDLAVAQAEKAEQEIRNAGELLNADNAISLATKLKAVKIARQAVAISNCDKKIADIQEKILDLNQVTE